MRKLIVLLLFAFHLSSLLQAQIKKGTIFIGGDASGTLSHTSVADSTYNSQHGISFSPAIGRAVKENLVFGGSIDISFFDNNYSSTYPDQKNYSYGAGVFLRKYKPIGNSGVYIFLQGSLNWNYRRYKQGAYLSWPPSTDSKQNVVYVSAFPGLSYAISRKLHLETGFKNLLSLNYAHEKKIENYPTPVTYSTNSVYADANLENLSSLYLGFRLLIGK